MCFKDKDFSLRSNESGSRVVPKNCASIGECNKKNLKHHITLSIDQINLLPTYYEYMFSSDKKLFSLS
jgi:hypothetical protein